MNTQPQLILTPGDPTGIGSEITVKALNKLDELAPMELTIIGSLGALNKASQDLSIPLPSSDQVNFIDCTADKPGTISYRALEIAVEMIARNKNGVLVTGPISKRNLAHAGHAYSGHTEILEHLSQRYFNTNARAEMLFVYKNLRLLLLTRHIALKDVSAALSVTGAVARPVKTLIAYLRHQVGISEPKLAMLGLNPHAGELENCDEEEKYFLPVIKAVNAIGASIIEGPFPADGFFRSFDMATTPFDAIIAPYHDQGLIPFKMLAGYEAVNVTIGLPFLRTSVSHGTAEDIVGKGIANEHSLIAAIKLAAASYQTSR